jgi:conjugal transfer pilus assembly protein TraW
MNSHAKNCGSQGSLYPIKEQSALVLIQQRLAQLQASGEIEQHQQKLKEQALSTVQRPKQVMGLTLTQHPRVFEKDLTLTFSNDIKGPHNEIIYKAGTRINPLANRLLQTKKVLIFLDGDDQKQLQWALQEHEKKRGLAKLVLINGAVLQLMRTYEVPFYFDQAGKLTRYFGFGHVPAMVYQQGHKLMIAEVKI